MTDALWSEDHLRYLLSYVLMEAADTRDGTVLSSVCALQLHVIPMCRPFSTWPEERRQAITREVILELARRGLAQFSHPYVGDGGMTTRKAETWRKAHLILELELQAILDAELPTWWTSDDHERDYDYVLTEEGGASAEALTDADLDELAKRVGDYPRTQPLLMSEDEAERWAWMSPDEAHGWEKLRRQELVGMTHEEKMDWMKHRLEERGTPHARLVSAHTTDRAGLRELLFRTPPPWITVKDDDEE